MPGSRFPFLRRAARALAGALGLVALWASGAAASAEDGAPPGPPLLWQIEGEGLAKPSWIFGTIHLRHPDVSELRPAVAAVQDQADATWCELAMGPDDLIAAAKAVLRPAGSRRLSDILPPALRSRAEAELQRVSPQLKLAQFDRLSVWALAVVLPSLEDDLKHGSRGVLDILIYDRARLAGREVGGLETLEEQMGVFGALGEKEQLALLRGTLDEMDKARRAGRSSFDEIRVAYRSGELAAIERVLLPGQSGLTPAAEKRLMEALLIRRNGVMAERMAAKMRAVPARSHFFAVGAGHLPGEKGVLRRLEKAGFRLTRVKAE